MKNYIAALYLALFSSVSIAQNYYEIDAHYGFGASELGFNNAPGVALSIYPKKNMSISAGIEYSFRQKTKEGAKSGENQIEEDGEYDDLILMYEFSNYKEARSAKILQIPLLFKYRFQPKNPSFYVSAGLKIGAPIKVSSEVSYKGLKTTGYYPGLDAPLTEPHFQGFGKQKDSSFAKKITSKNLYMLAFEHGISFDIGDNLILLAGVFADYSFNRGFSRKIPSVVERTEKENYLDGADLSVNDTWKSWKPWSVGLELKLAFGYDGKATPPPDTPAAPAVPERNHYIEIIADAFLAPLPPIPVEKEPETPTKEPKKEFKSPDLPDFLNRKAEFVFIYPETRTSPSDSAHVALLSRMADTLKTKPKLQLHCVGFSEKLISESVAYETALQRALRIKYTLNQFYSIDESRLFIYSQGSKGIAQRRAECHVF